MAVKKDKKSMSQADKRHIYEVLTRNFSCNEEHPLANLGWCFAQEGIEKEAYGCSKLKQVLEQMNEFVTLDVKEVGGVVQSFFVLKECQLDDIAPSETKQAQPIKGFTSAPSSHGDGEDAPKSMVKVSSHKKTATPVAPRASETPVEPRRRKVVPSFAPGKVLERFAYLGDWQVFLSTLAELALDEPWDFTGPVIDESEPRHFGILYNYIRYTFYRLTLEDKVGYSADEQFVAFNTGLVDKHYEDIYACFEPNPKTDAHQPWNFTGFCTAGTGRLGKQLVRELSPLPQPANYLERKEDLLFDLDRQIVCDINHIAVDNIDRFPLEFLRDELASSKECIELLDGIEQISDPVLLQERYDKVRELIAGDARLFVRISNSINAAIAVAKRQVRWNYKTAVPAYYPRTNSMNLLLPLNLTDDNIPDVALVVELQKSGNYQGQTVVTMVQAYRDARLLCRPYIDWLSPSLISDPADNMDED